MGGQGIMHAVSFETKRMTGQDINLHFKISETESQSNLGKKKVSINLKSKISNIIILCDWFSGKRKKI